MPIWHVLLRLSAEQRDTGEVHAIDAIGMDRVAASRHYANDPNDTVTVMNATVPIDHGLVQVQIYLDI